MAGRRHSRHTVHSDCHSRRCIRNLSGIAAGGTGLTKLTSFVWPDYRYQVHAPLPCRVRCSNRDSQHKIERTAHVHWVAELLQEGVMYGTGLGL
jgi:hypothetical protein